MITQAWVWSVSNSDDYKYLVSDNESEFLTRSTSKATVFDTREKATKALAHTFEACQKIGIEWPFSMNFSLVSVDIK